MANDKEIPLFPLNVVLFPNQLLPLHVFEERYKLMIGECLRDNVPFGVVLIQSGREAGGPVVPFTAGTTARICDVEYLEQGRMNLRTIGERAFRLLRLTQQRPYMRGEIEPIEYESANLDSLSEVIEVLKSHFSDHLEILAQLSNRKRVELDLDVEPEGLSFLVASILAIQNSEKQELLELTRTEERLQREMGMLVRENRTLQTFLYLRKQGPVGPPDQSQLGDRISRN